MDDYYKALRCANDASQEELKAAFQKLARKHHPDKQHNRTQQGDSDAATFIQIKKAWDVLSDAAMRKDYDARWKQRCVAQDWPVQDEVCVEDFVPAEEEEELKEETEKGDGRYTSFVYDCRCGGQYTLSATDIGFKMDYVTCSSCSLCIRIIYQDEHT